MDVSLSQDTLQKLIATKKELYSSIKSISLQELLDLINESAQVGLRVLLLQDLAIAFEQKYKRKIIIKKETDLKKNHKILFFIALGATLLNVLLDGFSSMSVLLSIVVNVATAGISLLWASIGFAVLYSAFFIFYQLCEEKKSFDGSDAKPPSDLMLYMQERSLVNSIINFMDSSLFFQAIKAQEINVSELSSLKKTLKNRNVAVKALAQRLEDKRNSKLVVFTQHAIITALAIWSLTYGFMTGFFFLGMIVTLFPAISIPLWSCLLLGAITGLTALTVYWIKGRGGVKKVIEIAMHLDKELIDALGKEPAIDIDNIATTQIHSQQNRLDLGPTNPTRGSRFFSQYSRLGLGPTTPTGCSNFFSKKTTLKRCNSANDIHDFLLLDKVVCKT